MRREPTNYVSSFGPRLFNLSTLLEDIGFLRLGEGDREGIIERLSALDIKDLSAIEPASKDQLLHSIKKMPSGVPA
jgi:hypothetical protein